MSEFFAEEIDSGARCVGQHRIWLVAEGYGYCVKDFSNEVVFGPEFAKRAKKNPDLYRPELYAWRFSPPRTSTGIYSVTGCQWEQKSLAWVQSGYSYAKSDILAGILADIEAHRALPFDEEAERARLMPV